jgi:hypothetical protein
VEELASTIPPEVVARVRELGDRFLAISEVLHLLRELDVDKERLRLTDTRALSADDDLKLLVRMQAGAPEYARTLARLEELAQQIEATLVELDENVPSATFRLVLSTAHVGPVLLLQYARMIARHFRATALHTERLQALVQKLLTLPKLDGAREIRPREDTEAALRYIVRESEAPASLRAAALEFFAAATVRIHAIQRLDEIFDGGFYLDILGYQVSLRESLVDAEILRAAVELNAALWNQLVGLMKLEGISLAQAYERMSSVEEQVAKIFLSLEPDEPSSIAQRFELRQTKEAAERQEAVKLLKPRHGLRVFAAVVLAIALGLGVGVLRRSSRNENELVALEAGALAALSPVLESGSASKGLAEPILFAQVQASKWVMMNDRERSQAASRLAVAIGKKNMGGALIFQGNAIVIQVSGGNVLFVQ